MASERSTAPVELALENAAVVRSEAFDVVVVKLGYALCYLSREERRRAIRALATAVEDAATICAVFHELVLPEKVSAFAGLASPRIRLDMKRGQVIAQVERRDPEQPYGHMIRPRVVRPRAPRFFL